MARVSRVCHSVRWDGAVRGNRLVLVECWSRVHEGERCCCIAYSVAWDVLTLQSNGGYYDGKIFRCSYVNIFIRSYVSLKYFCFL